MNHFADTIVIGGGAAGMIAAVKAAENNRSVFLLEKADRPGRKILASGNGRCNLMNHGAPRYYGESEFALSVLEYCPFFTLKNFFAYYGLMITEEEDGRIYPLSYQAASVVSVLRTAMQKNGVRMKTLTPVSSVEYADSIFTISSGDESCFHTGQLIIACGGAAQPALGGTSDGYRFLSSLGHSIAPITPALVPLQTDKKSISGLSGLRVRCIASILSGNKVLHREQGEVLFTDYGVSGICIMQCARFIQEEETILELDLLCNAFDDINQAAVELRRRKKLFESFSPLYLLDGIIASKLSYAVLKQAGIPMRGETCRDLTDIEIYRIAETGFHYRISVSCTRGINYAQVTSGGALCSEFEPSTMSSRIVPGLHAAGEVLNVDGDCGGFNLMFAFASGYIAGSST